MNSRSSVGAAQALALALALISAGCGVDDQPAPNPDSEAGAEDATPLAGLEGSLPEPTAVEGILPVYQSERELRAAKTDRIDVRASFNEIYGVTDAPSGRLRAIAEFEPADGVLIAWSGDLSVFFADLVQAIGDASTVYIVTPDLSYTGALRDYLLEERVDLSNTKFFEYAHEAFWARDYGPWVVETSDGSPAFVDVGYYPDRQRDDAIPTLVGAYFDVPTYRPDFAAEGGNFMANGEGVCAVTNWMLQQNGLSSGGPLEQRLRDYMGCDQTVIVERLDGEGTGHIDMFAKFLSPGVVLVGDYDSRVEPVNAAILDRNAAQFARVVRPNGRRLQVVRIPMPRAGHPVYRSYTNSLLINGVAVVPIYDTDRGLEDEVVRIYRQALPAGYEINLVDSSDIIEYGGAVHCVTMGFQTGSVRPGGLTTPDPEPEPEPDPEPDPQPEPQPEPAGEGWTVRADAPIRDRQVTESRITVPAGQGAVQTVSVTVDIAHTYRGDLTLALAHQGADALIYRGEGNGQDLRQTFTTTAFRGADAGGEWTLLVADNADQDEGTLVSWTLEINPGGGVEEPGPAVGGDLSSSPNLAIEDESEVSDTIRVDSSDRLGSVTVNVDIRHTYVGDLQVLLVHAGQQIALHRRTGGGAADLTRSWEISNFEGLPAGGAWTLTVSDHAAGDTGKLVAWSLEL